MHHSVIARLKECHRRIKRKALLFFKQKSIIVLGIKGITLPYKYLVNVLVTRLFSPAAVGVFSIIRSYVRQTVSFLGLGADKTSLMILSHAYHKDKEEFKHATITLLYIFTIIGGGTSLILILAAKYVSLLLFGSINYTLFIRIGSLVVILQLLYLLGVNFFKAMNKPILSSVIEIGVWLLLPFIIILLLILKTSGLSDTLTLVLSWAISYTLTALIFLMYLKARHFFRNKGTIKLAGIKNVFKSGFVLNIVNILYSFNTNIAVFFMPRVISVKEVGIFYVVQTIALVLNIPLNAVLTIAPHKITKFIRNKQWLELESYLIGLQKKLFLLGFPIFVGIVLLGKLMLSFFGAVYESGYLALIILAVAEFVNTIAGPNGIILVLLRKGYLFALSLGLALSLQLAALLFFLPRLGIVGAALAYACGFISLNILALFFVHRELNIGIKR